MQPGWSCMAARSSSGSLSSECQLSAAGPARTAADVAGPGVASSGSFGDARVNPLGHVWVSAVDPVETNIVIFEIAAGLTAAEFVEAAAPNGIHCFAFGPQRVRMVVHRDLDQGQVDTTCSTLTQSVLNR